MKSFNIRKIIIVFVGIAVFFAAVFFGFKALPKFFSKSDSIENITYDFEKSEQYLNVSKGICKFLAEGNTEVGYNRMEDSYKVIVSEESYDAEWNRIMGKADSYDVHFGVDNMKAYCNVYADFTAQKGKKKSYAVFVFCKGALRPIDIIFLEKPHIFSSKKALKDSGKQNYTYDDSMKDLASNYFKFGCGLTGYSPSNFAINLPEYMELVDKHFSSCTFTNLMKPPYILSQSKSIENYDGGSKDPVLDFSAIDSTLQWCMEHKVQVRGHTLVWHTQIPDWFFRVGYRSDTEFVSREEMIERTDSYIKQYLTYVQTKYPGTVYCWDVVNECVDPGQGDKSTNFCCRTKLNDDPNLWYEVIGNDYPEIAFTIARKYADPDVKLIYNDFNTYDRTKRQCIYNLLKDLKAKGLVDGVGMQANWDMRTPDSKTIAETINLWATLDLEVMITEWSIAAPDTTEEGFEAQAQRYASILRLLQKLDTQGGGNANITCVSFFGLMDGYPLYGNDDSTFRLWDTDYNPKPVFYSMYDTFKNFY